MDVGKIYEQRLIGGIAAGLVDPLSIPLASEDLPELGEYLAAARKLKEAGRKPDAAMLVAGCVDGFYTVSDVNLWSQSAGSTSVVFDAVEHLKSASLKTFLLKQTADIALKENVSASALLEELETVVSHARNEFRSVADDFQMMGDLIPQVETVMTDLHNRVTNSVPSGFSELDAMILDGFTKGDLHIIAGSTGSGKTALALNFVLNQAKKDNLVGLVSREMSSTENILRLLCSDANVERWKIKKGIFADQYNSLVSHLNAGFAELPIAINTATSTVQSLRPQVRRWVDQKGMRILYVDYLQLLSSEARHGSRADEVNTVSRTLKLIAMENHIPVVSLCQFNRGANQADDFELLSYLKESSGIEQDASTVSHIKIERSELPTRKAELRILKNRNGATMRTVQMDFHGPTFTFTQTAPPPKEDLF